MRSPINPDGSVNHQDLVRLLIMQALEKLQDAADILRGPDVPASQQVMSCEIAVTKAMDALNGNKLS